MIFDASDHARLATLFQGDPADDRGTYPYAGYRPAVREAPNGDAKSCEACKGSGWAYPIESRAVSGRYCQTCNGAGRVPNVDTDKRYLHVALKYDPPAWALEYLARAHFEACRVAEALGVPAEFYPRVADGTLRVLEYPSAAHQWGEPDALGGSTCTLCGRDDDRIDCAPVEVRTCPKLSGAGSAEHTDFDLFTILCWRSTPEDLEVERRTLPAASQRDVERYAAAVRMSPGLHIGELGELVGLGPATPHRVPARPYAQKSIVYFAMPDHGARLPHAIDANGLKRGRPTVGEWLKDRMARSRVEGYT